MQGDGGIERRSFLRGALGAAALGAGGALAPSAAAAHGWHRHHGRRLPRSWIGIQLWTVRSAFWADAEGTFRALAAAGYRNVELIGSGYAVKDLRRWLHRYGLAAPYSHNGVEELQGERLAQTIANAKALRQRYIVLPWVGEEFRTPEGVERLATILNTAGRAVRAAGLRLGYHNHDFEFTTMVGGRRMYDALLELTDPRLVSFELDCYWCLHGGADPAAVVRQARGRIRLFHVKGRAADGTMVDVGSPEDAVDWGALFRISVPYGVREYIIENDNEHDPRTSPRAADMYRYLSSLKF